MPKYEISEISVYEVEALSAQEAMDKFLSTERHLYYLDTERFIYDESGALCDVDNARS